MRGYKRVFLPLILSGIPEDYRLTCQSAFAPIEVWSQIQHPSIIGVREAFTTHSFGDNCTLPIFISHIFLTLVYSPCSRLRLLFQRPNTL